ncbi:hypothetical protein CAPTEDRAFT_194369 [Capitella teleta]|uniref:SWIM-type domain-containing protein n=1 Tax=Capitella teleta TaxID=283909 RepID=R7V6K6_CAPTE|nr:hypothetical protein CAPTEDRAFT_194369 [Capitella teleta]|eukprot:ELU11400.1 hypothetical protein CAPTEDRAFT_194369 [Capitella teleta]
MNFGRDIRCIDEKAFEMKPTDFKDINADCPVSITFMKIISYCGEESISYRSRKKRQGASTMTVRAFYAFTMEASVLLECLFGFGLLKEKRKVDEHGNVQECLCECGASMGPHAHCQHVMLVLLASRRHQGGIKTAETCTQVLQTFHKAKKYVGSTKKMVQLEYRKAG